MELIGGTLCNKCKKGKYHFHGLVIKRIDYGLGDKFLEYECDACRDILLKPYLVKPKQLSFALECK